MLAMYTNPGLHPVVVLVEDLESLRESIQQMLEDAGFLVLPAASAGQALVDHQASSRRNAGPGPGFSFEKTFSGNVRPI
jgi:hypothetical protein